MIKRFINFQKVNVSDEINESSYSDIKDYIKTLVEKTIENNGGEFKSFVESYIKNPSDVKIEGLINESDIYEFYLEYRNDIDEILNNIKFFEDTPSENESYGLYDYLITGTEKCLLEVMNMIN